jgi:hypothetical protein
MAVGIDFPSLPGWVNESEEDSGGVVTFFRNPTRSGPLQFSWRGFGEQRMEMDVAKLTEMAASFGEAQFGCGPAREKSSGPCGLGTFGSATFSAPPDRCFGQVWILYAGTGILLATYMSAGPPAAVEVQEAQQIVLETEFMDGP